mgnify:FL=1
MTANLEATVPLIEGLMILVGNVFELGLDSLVKQLFHVLVKVSLIPLERQDIVGPLLENLLGNRGLRPLRVEGDDAALEV